MFQVLRFAMLKSQCVIDGDGIACEQLDHVIGFPNPPRIVRAPLTGEEVMTQDQLVLNQRIPLSIRISNTS